MNKFQMRRSFRAIAVVLISGSVVLTACTAPPPSPGTPPQASAPTAQASPIARTPIATPDATGQIEQDVATGTLQGHVNIGPLQPVVRVDEPTPVVPPEAYAARQIVVYAADGQTEITRVQIGPDGNYAMVLPPGAYVVDLTRSGIDRSNLPAKIQIATGQTTTLDVEIDTGIR